MREIGENNKIAPPHCSCDPPLTCSLRLVNKENVNKGKYFFGCPIFNPDLKRSNCDYFIWEEVWRTHGDTTRTANANHVSFRTRRDSQEEQSTSHEKPSSQELRQAYGDSLSDEEYYEAASQATDKLEAEYRKSISAPAPISPHVYYTNDYRNNGSSSIQTPGADRNNTRSTGLITPNTTPEKSNKGIIKNLSRNPPPRPNFTGGNSVNDPFISHDNDSTALFETLDRTSKELKARVERSDRLLYALEENEALSLQNDELKKEIESLKLAKGNSPGRNNNSNDNSNANSIGPGRGGDDGSGRATEWGSRLLRHENTSLKSRITELEKEVEEYKRDEGRPLTRKRTRI